MHSHHARPCLGSLDVAHIPGGFSAYSGLLIVAAWHCYPLMTSEAQVDVVCARGEGASHMGAHLMLLSFLQATKSALVNYSQRARSIPESQKHFFESHVG